MRCTSSIRLAAFALAPCVVAAAQELPNVLLIGDSIQGGYTPAVRELLKGKANVHGVNRKIINGATDNGVEELASWLGDTRWSVIHFNWGLWDLKVGKDGRNVIPIEQYGANLRKLIVRMKQTKAKLIFASTTPVPEYVSGNGRRSVDVPLYNAVARKICEEEQVPIDDLNAYIAPRIAQFQLPNNVHFTKDGSAYLARHVAMSIEFLLDMIKATM